MKTNSYKLAALGSTIEHGVSSFNVAEKSLEVAGWLADHPSATAAIAVAVLGLIIWYVNRRSSTKEIPAEVYLIERVGIGKWALRTVGGSTVISVNTKKQAIALTQQCLAGRTNCIVHVRNGDGSADHTFTPNSTKTD